jgi:hypothetical protein
MIANNDQDVQALREKKRFKNEESLDEAKSIRRLKSAIHPSLTFLGSACV